MVSSGAMDYRLPATVVPQRYDLRLEPNLDAATFAGTVSIIVEVREPVIEILLNAAELAIESVAVSQVGSEPIYGSASLDEAAERARLVFPVTITPGQWRLPLPCSRPPHHNLPAFYR